MFEIWLYFHTARKSCAQFYAYQQNVATIAPANRKWTHVTEKTTKRACPMLCPYLKPQNHSNIISKSWFPNFDAYLALRNTIIYHKKMKTKTQFAST